MTPIFKVGDKVINAHEVVPLLADYQLLPQLIKEIVIDQAIAEVECIPQEIQSVYQQFFQQNQLSPENLPAWLKQNKISKEQLENKLLRKLKLEKFKRLTWSNKIESYFLKRKGQLDRVVYSLIRTQNPGIAQELYFRIAEGEKSFPELAQQYSEGSEAQTGGLIGPVEINTPHVKIAQMLNSGKPGQLWPPTRVGEWLVIVRLEKLLPAQLDEAMRQKLLNELFEGWLSEQVQQKVSFPPFNGQNEEEIPNQNS
ncbi:MAG: peptidylprolyl isomerase [Oscillatoria sp. PMC 1068.18]|nr:peptidylprolyl isomerase [Oscillatoria sp. PMC 1076.18]MEC4990927.1 peptidylprolyl isomerase [Oscillatoria sp. PMC 1068.18]